MEQGPSKAGFVTQGFRFSNNADVIDISISSPWASQGPAYSGNYAALNDYGGPIVITSEAGDAFSFQNLYMTSWGNMQMNGSITGFLGATQVGYTSFSFGSAWQEAVGDFENVDKLVIAGDYYFLLDDISLNEGAAPVPEPSTALLLGAGLAGIALLRRKAKST